MGYGIREAAGSLRTNRTVITGNGGTGVYALGSAQLIQTDISANALDGITVNAPGDVVLAECSINRNGKWGIDQLGGTVYTMHDNVVYGNGIADTFGSLTTLTPK